jgi:hypothetical protein
MPRFQKAALAGRALRASDSRRCRRKRAKRENAAPLKGVFRGRGCRRYIEIQRYINKKKYIYTAFLYKPLQTLDIKRGIEGRAFFSVLVSGIDLRLN